MQWSHEAQATGVPDVATTMARISGSSSAPAAMRRRRSSSARCRRASGGHELGPACHPPGRHGLIHVRNQLIRQADRNLSAHERLGTTLGCKMLNLPRPGRREAGSLLTRRTGPPVSCRDIRGLDGPGITTRDGTSGLCPDRPTAGSPAPPRRGPCRRRWTARRDAVLDDRARPGVRVAGVESAGAASLQTALAAGAPDRTRARSSKLVDHHRLLGRTGWRIRRILCQPDNALTCNQTEIRQ